MTKKKVVEEEESEAERYKKLRKAAIDELKKLVKNKPDEFDTDRLDEAIAKVNSVPDENLDAFLIMQVPFRILCKQVQFTKEEIKTVRDMLKKNFSGLKFSQCDKDDRTRDDLQFSVKTKNCEMVIGWVNKMRPMYEDDGKGYYNILMCGDMFSCCNDNFHKFDDMVAKLKSKLENYKG